MKVVLAVVAVLAAGATEAMAQGETSTAAAKVRELMMKRLADPLSAQIVVNKGPWRAREKVVGDTVEGDWYCASINAKNAYGGFVGFRDYLLVDGEGGRKLVWEYGDSPLLAIDRAARKLCRVD